MLVHTIAFVTVESFVVVVAAAAARISSRFVVADVAVWIQVEYPLPLPEYALLTYLESIIHDQLTVKVLRLFAGILPIRCFMCSCFGLPPVTLKHAWHRLEEWLYHIQEAPKSFGGRVETLQGLFSHKSASWRNCK